MDRLKATLLTAFLISILLTPTAFAQATAQSVQIISGNGQLICATCGFGKQDTIFYPMVVKVTDVSGNPIAGKTINWQQVSFSGGTAPFFNTTTVTDVNGLSVNNLSAGAQFASLGTNFLQSVIVATADTASATFTETQSLTLAGTGAQIAFSTLTPLAGPLTGPAGSTGTVPVQIHIDAFGVGIPNVSLRLRSPEVTASNGKVTLDPTTPSASCATGPGADPGSVLNRRQRQCHLLPGFRSGRRRRLG